MPCKLEPVFLWFEQIQVSLPHGFTYIKYHKPHISDELQIPSSKSFLNKLAAFHPLRGFDLPLKYSWIQDA